MKQNRRRGAPKPNRSTGHTSWASVPVERCGSVGIYMAYGILISRQSSVRTSDALFFLTLSLVCHIVGAGARLRDFCYQGLEGVINGCVGVAESCGTDTLSLPDVLIRGPMEVSGSTSCMKDASLWLQTIANPQPWIPILELQRYSSPRNESALTCMSC